MTKREMSKAVRQIKKHRDQVGKERDSIRSTIAELEDLEEVCDCAYRDLESAADALSQVV